MVSAGHKAPKWVWADVITAGGWMLWGTDEVWVDVIMVFAHGCSGERMRSWWTLSWFDPWMLWGAQEVGFDVTMIFPCSWAGKKLPVFFLRARF